MGQNRGCYGNSVIVPYHLSEKMNTSNYHQANGIFVFCIQYLFNVLLQLINGFVIFYKGRIKPANVLSDLVLKVSQNTSPSRAQRTYVFANNVDKIIMTLGKYSFEFNSRMHQMKFTG